MPIPANYTTVQVRGTYIDLQGNALAGSVTFTPAASVINDASALVTIIGVPVVATLNSSGSFTVTLPATDDPDVSPTNFTYQVTEVVGGNTRSYNLSVPVAKAGTGIDIPTVVPANAATGTVTPYKLTDLGDIAISSPTNNQVLTYDSATQKWKNAAASGGGSSTSPVGGNTSVEPTGVTASSIPRYALNNGTIGTANQTLLMVGVWLQSGTVVNTLKIWSGGTASSGQSNAWMGLFDSSRVMLARSADRTTTAIPSTTLVSFPITTVSSGAASSFTTTYTGLHYIGIAVNATTLPTFFGRSDGQGTYVNSEPPIIVATSSTGQTTPPAFPFTAAALTATNGGIPYVAAA